MRGWTALFAKRLRDHLAILILCTVMIVVICLTFVYLNNRIGTVKQLEQIWGVLLQLFKNVTGREAPDRAASMSVPRFVASSYLTMMMQIALIAFPIAVAARGLAGEIGAGTSDMLLAQPLRRGVLYAVNVAVIVVGAVVFGVAGFVTIQLSCMLVGTIEPLPVDRFGWVAVNATSLAICTGGIALLFSASVSDYGRAVLGPMIVMLTMGIFELMASMWDALDGARCLGLYFYYNPLHIADGKVHRVMTGAIYPGQWAVLASGVLLAVGIICMIAGYLIYRRRDIATI